MPNILGLYTLSEMRERVRRVQNSLQAVVDTTTGLESDATINPLYSNDDLNFFINSAVTSVWTDCILNSDTIYADEELIDIKKDIVEYQLPDDFAQLRELRWKPVHERLLVIPISHRRFMHLVDESCTEEFIDDAPTYRLNIDAIVLNHAPHHDNPGGILIRYIKHSQFLDNDESYLETKFAKVMQEAVIREAAAEAVESRGQLDASNIKAQAQAWKDRLSLTVRNIVNPPFMQMIAPSVQTTRRRRRERYMA